jgi:hypothetical protein
VELSTTEMSTPLKTSRLKDSEFSRWEPARLPMEAT